MATTEALGVIGRRTAHHTNSVKFRHELGDGHKLWDGFKRATHEILIQSRNDDSFSELCQLVTYVDKIVVEKLAFIDSDDIGVRREQNDLRRGSNARRLDDILVMRDDFGVAKTDIHSGFEDFDRLASNFRSFQATNEFFRLPTEHGSADHFNPARFSRSP